LAALVAFLTMAAGGAVGTGLAPAGADSYVPIAGAGSSWSANALNQWIADVYSAGMRVDYAATGSSDGRSQFLNGTVDFAASDIPFQSHPTDGSAPELPKGGSYAYIPVTAGGTAFMYNLVINGQRVTNLRLSGQNVAKIFTGAITTWNDPAVAADNPRLVLPNVPIVPVVRSDGSGSTAQFTLWMIAQYPDVWNAFCQASGRASSGGCGATSFYPTVTGMIAQSGDLGVAGYVSQNYANGAIGYVNYSYALGAKFPVIKVINAAGYYTEPTPDNVAVSLLKAQVDTSDVNDPSLYLTQQLGGVYTDNDPRTYVLSSYSYMILPTTVQGQFTTAKGKTLAAFAYYAMCQGQSESASLGYSPMPYNLVQDTFSQITKIPGAVVENVNIQSCHNPTFSTTSPNLLADTAPQPQACDKQGGDQCANGTAGDTNPTTLTGGSVGSGSGGGTNPAGGGGGTSSSGSGSGSSGTSSAGSGAPARSTAPGRAGAPAAVGAAGGGVARPGTAPRGGAATTGAKAGGAAVGTAATGGATGAAGAASTACDPSSGGCSGPTGDASASDSGSGAFTQAALAGTTLIPAKRGWTSTQTLMVFVALMTAAVVVAPALTYRYVVRRWP